MIRTTLQVLAVAALCLSGCGGRQTALADDALIGAKTGDASAKVTEARALWNDRADRAKVDAAIKVWEEAAALDPTRADIQLDLSYAYYFLAYAHLKWADDEDGMLAAYDRGVVAGEKAIKLTAPDFALRIKNGEEWEKAIPTVGPDGLKAMYWYATNLGRWATLNGFTTILSLKDRIAAIMKRCLELDETFFHGAPHRYFGVYRTKIPFPSGDLPASRKHFERALQLAPNYADTRVLFAQEYAVKAGDRELYKKLLEEASAMTDDVIPELVPETRNAKRMAQKLLAEIDDNF